MFVFNGHPVCSSSYFRYLHILTRYIYFATNILYFDLETLKIRNMEDVSVKLLFSFFYRNNSKRDNFRFKRNLFIKMNDWISKIYNKKAVAFYFKQEYYQNEYMKSVECVGLYLTSNI